MAAKNLTRLNVALTATIGPFATAMKSAAGVTKQFGDGLRNALLSPLSALTGALSAGGFIAGIKASAERIDALAKSADRLGITTQSLAGLRLAADESGSSAEQLESAMARLTKTVGDAAAGSTSARESLTRLGLSTSQLVAARPDEQFKLVADAINRLDTQGKKTTATFDLFGKGALGLANTIALGSAGLNKATEDAEKLGLSISRVDASKVEEANDAFGRIGKVIQGVFDKIAVRLAPFITAIAESFTTVATDANDFGDTIDNVMAFALKAGGFIADAWQGLGIVWLALKQGLYQVGTAFAFLGDLATRTAQWIAGKFVAAWDLILAAWTVVGNSLLVAWAAMKVPLAAFVQFAGEQLAAMIRNALEVAGLFSNEMANSMAVAAARIETSVRTMSDNAKADLDQTLTSLAAASSDVVAKTDALFAEVKTTGSQTLQDLGQAFWQLAQEQGQALSLALGDERASDRFNRVVAEVQGEAQVRAEARAAEVTAQQDAATAAAVAEAEQLQARESVWMRFYDALESQRGKDVQRAVSGSSSMFANLARLQDLHGKTAQRLGKASAKAKIVTDTASAAMGAYSAMASIPFIGPALGIAAAAAAVAAGAIQLGNVDKGGISTTGAAGPADSSTTNIGGVAAPAPIGQTLVLQGDTFSAESLMKLFSEAKERGFVIDGVRRG